VSGTLNPSVKRGGDPSKSLQKGPSVRHPSDASVRRRALAGFADVFFGPATRLPIRVKQPETEHTVSVGKLQAGSMAARMSRC